MERKPLLKRLLSGTLAVAVAVSGLTFTSSAEDNNGIKLGIREINGDRVSAALPGREQMSSSEEAPYADDDSVRVSIILDDKSTIASGFEVENIAQNAAAQSYREKLQAKQDSVVASIEDAIDGDLDVVWNLTLAANLVSANVEYGQIEEIEKVQGVKEVLIETRYEPDVVVDKPELDPNMATSSAQTGSSLAWAAGYTGAGSRIAIIDTGTDTDHQSFAEAGYLHSLEKLAEEKGVSFDEYVKSLNLLTKEEIDSVKDQLNAGLSDYWQEGASGGPVDTDRVYYTQKLPFGYNYVDHDYDITHDNDGGSEHGSHVAGIATANSYIETPDGSFEPALTYAHTQGAAPDAQLITMKVFGKGGGAYDSDYMAAIEDAVILKADSVNLSLGSGNPGSSKSATAFYQAVMESLSESGVVVAMSAGNSYSWPEFSNTLTGNLYAEDVSMQTDGSPGSFTNSFTVASIDNIGTTGNYIEAADGSVIFYNESPSDSGYNSLTTLAGEQSYILIDGFGTAEDWAALGGVLEGKIAVLSRGSINFTAKGNHAVEAGAVATIVYNNAPGTISMSGDGYKYKAPYLSVTQADGAVLKAQAAEKTTEDGTVYYEGTLTVAEGFASAVTNDGSTMSDFSSWGVPGSLQLKPEITAPGGNIFSVNGAIPGGTAYENMSGTSMASPQIAGLSALAAQYIRENGLVEKTGLTPRTLIQSLLMSTAEPVFEDLGADGLAYYPVLKQGAGLANINSVISAESYILMGEDATVSAKDGKVKAELGDDPEKKGEYTFSFSVNNITSNPIVYNLSADLFTQAPYAYYVNNKGTAVGYYMDSATTLLDSEATFVCGDETVTSVVVPANGSETVTVTLKISEDDKALLDEYFANGAYVEGYVYVTPAVSYDFNNDGVVDEQDAQAILDYRTTVKDEIYNAKCADIDGDGDIDTRDAYLFLEKLESGDLDVGEGVIGVTHSIPVLGFYGNWTDPSMYDVGTRLEYNAGTELHDPYLGNKNVNSFGVTYANEPGKAYYFGGNPVVSEAYLPERGAINANDAISMVSFAAIRNAAASFFEVRKDGETVARASMGSVNAAYYYVNGGRWNLTSYTKQIGFTPAALGLKTGDSIEISMVLVPEYYVDENGSVAFDKLGEGAYMTVPVVIDNAKPNIVGDSVTYNPENHTLTLTASDNEYVAGVVLYNRNGTEVLSYTGSKSDIEKGVDAEYVLETDGIKGKQFIIQVIDYANNVRTYVCNEDIGSDIPLPDMMAVNNHSLLGTNWISIFDDPDAANQKDWDIYMPANHNYVAATIADHYIFAVTEDNKLYVMPEDDLDNAAYINDLPCDIFDMAYNPADGELYAAAMMQGYPILIGIDKLTGGLTQLYFMPEITITLACDENGVFYYNPYQEDSIKKFTLDGLSFYDDIESDTLCASVGIGSSASFMQAMEIDPNRSVLCWTSINTQRQRYYVEVNTETGAATKFNNLSLQLYSLVIPDKAPVVSAPAWAAPADTATNVIISDTSVSLFRNGTTQLSANVLPWTLTDRSVTWTSSDETVAKVSADGTVTALKAGRCVITATSNATGTVKSSCAVVVENVQITLSGALQDAEGKAQFFEWNMETDETWTGGNRLSLNGEITSVTASDKYVYIGTSEDTYYQIDPATGENLAQGSGFGLPYADMAYSTLYSTAEGPLVGGVAEAWFLGPDDPLAPTGRGYDLTSYLAQYTGSDSFIAVASMGEIEVEQSDGSTYTAERFVALTDNGALWSLFAKTSGGLGLNFYSTNLPADFLGSNSYGEYCSMVYGDDGYLYLSAHDGDTNNIYRLEVDDENETCTAAYMGNVGADVWPAALISVESNVKAPAAAERISESDMLNAGLMDAKVELEEIKVDALTENTAKTVETYEVSAPAENLTKVRAATLAETDAVINNNVVGGTLEAKLTTSSTENGLILVSYDADVLSLGANGVTSPVDFSSYKIDNTNGKLIIGFANHPETAASETSTEFVLKFNAKSTTASGTTPIDVIFAEVGELDIIPADKSVVTYGPETDGYSDQLEEWAENEGKTPDEFVRDNGIVQNNMPVNIPISNTNPSNPVVTDPNEPQPGETGTNPPDVSVPGTEDPGTTTKPDDNMETGVGIFLAPAAISAIAVIVSKKRRK